MSDCAVASVSCHPRRTQFALQIGRHSTVVVMPQLPKPPAPGAEKREEVYISLDVPFSKWRRSIGLAGAQQSVKLYPREEES